MIPWPTLPYEIIGKSVVALIVVTTLLVGIITLGIGLFALWIRGWQAVSNYMWRGCEPGDNHPSLWKVRISSIATALYTFQITKMPAAYREAEEIADDYVTLVDEIRYKINGEHTND